MRQNSTVGTANHRHRYFGLTNLYTMKKKPAVPRTIDIDILDYEGVSCRNQSLTLPHPGLSLRLFVSSSSCPCSISTEITDCKAETLSNLLQEPPLASQKAIKLFAVSPNNF